MRKNYELLQLLIFRFKRFLKHVPGFRTGEKENMIIASIYYTFYLLLIFIGLIFLNGRDKYSFIGFSCIGLLFPAFIFILIDNINNRFHII